MRFPLLKFFLASLALATLCPALTNTTPKKSGGETIAAPQPAQAASQSPAPATQKTRVMVIQIHSGIEEPALYLLRRGLKEAEEKNYNTVIIDMKTGGGPGDIAFEMMEAIGKYSGQTFTYVNDEAMSAGSFVAAVTNEIWFSPHGVIGASAAVTGTGQDLSETMRLKINSYLRAKIRALTEGKGYRGQAVEAMIDKDYVLEIDGEIIKPKGELLSRTATEAMKLYGDPPQPLLGAGIASDINDLLVQKFGPDNFDVTHLEITWSEKLAQWLNMIKPILMGLGMLALFIEFKTPGFGFFGIAGIVLLAVVFLSSYVAGLSGHEPMILFTIGLLIVVAELIFFPGLVLPVITGTIMMLGSLVWAMADIWPGDPISVAWTTDALVAPIMNLGFGLLIGTVLILALLRYMPKSWFWDRLELASEIGGAAQVAGLAPEEAATLASLIGRRARVVTPLRPFGQIEIDGKHYEARFPLGTAEPGTTVIVRGHTDFSLDVEPEGKA